MNAPGAAHDGAVDAWERFAATRPRLRPHVRIHRHVYRGQPWFVVQDRAAARHFRMDPATYEVVARLDGSRTLGELHAETAAAGEEAPDPEELLVLVAQLADNDLIRFDRPADAASLSNRAAGERRQRWRSRLARPLAMRFGLVDPDRLLCAAEPLARRVFSTGGLLVWAAAVTAAAVLAGIHWQDISSHVSSRMFDPANLVLLAVLYPPVKGLHELGHALAIKARGGEVHEMGIMLLVLVPVPYVDASASSAFPAKRHRMAVGAAGILVETFLAALGVFVWFLVEPGILRDAALDVAMIGGVSTLLFNGNPLVRFDGYYVLADAIEIPNLGPRSTRYYGYLARRYLLGLADAASPVRAAGERAWFAAYGLGSTVYRVGISLTIALYVAGRFPVVGIVLAVWALIVQLALPLLRQAAFVLFDPAVRGRRAIAVGVSVALLAGAAAALHLVPAPSRTVAEGYVRLPEQSMVRAETGGVIHELLRRDGDRVEAGDAVATLEAPDLQTRVEVLRLRREELIASRVQAAARDERTRASILDDDLAEVEDELLDARGEVDKLVVRAAQAGTLTIPREEDAPGRFLAKGEVLGYVVDESAPIARVVVPQTRVDLIRRQTVGVEVCLAGRPDTAGPAEVLRAVPSASGRLPNRMLGSQGGGAIAVDARDEEGLTAIEPVFEFDLVLLDASVSRAVGGRVLARFEHPDEPLTRQWGRRLSQLLLARLNL